jgi:RNA polymerase sigma-70 factor, ECF subfamily
VREGCGFEQGVISIDREAPGTSGYRPSIGPWTVRCGIGTMAMLRGRPPPAARDSPTARATDARRADPYTQQPPARRSLSAVSVREPLASMTQEAAARAGPLREARPATFPVSSPSTADVDDDALSRALVAGDGQAFRRLVERETPRVFRTCYRILGRVDEAEDATQETFVLAYRALGTFRGDGHPAAWLTRIATREAWRRAADRSRRRLVTAQLDVSAEWLASNAPSPLAAVIASDEAEQVRLAVARMPDQYREVITLRFFADLSLLEICAATGRPEGTVKAQLHRGLKRLRADLAGDGA